MELQNFKILRVLTILLTITLAIVSVAGAFFPATYERDAPSMAAQGVGQDLVNLFLVVPLLLVSFFLQRKKIRITTLVYGGTLFYIAYSFIIYCFGVHFNRLFLLYCATLGLSTYAFIIYMMDITGIRMHEWFQKAPVKLVSYYLLAVSVIFYGLWLKSILPALVHDSAPAEVKDYGLLVNPVHVIDMAIALPGLVTGAILLLKQKNLGYIIASLALVFMIILTIALAGMVIVLVKREISEDFTVAAVFGVLTLTSITVMVLFFRKLRSGEGDRIPG